MMQVEEIQAAIQALPPESFVQLRQWLLEKDREAWDRQIEADAKAGKLDFLIREALAEKAGGNLQEL